MKDIAESIYEAIRKSRKLREEIAKNRNKLREGVEEIRKLRTSTSHNRAKAHTEESKSKKSKSVL